MLTIVLGPGCNARRKEKLYTEITAPRGIVHAFHRKAQTAILQRLNDSSSTLHHDVDAKLEPFLSSLENMVNTKTFDSREDQALRACLKTAIIEAKRVLQEEVEPLLHECEVFGKVETAESVARGDRRSPSCFMG